MKCPVCGFPESKVVDSRPIEDGSNIRRRRECLSCGKRFTTFEILETVQIMVIKKNGNKVVFDRSKLRGGILKATHKRPVDADAIVNEIEAELQNTLRQEITSVELGEMVMDRLKALDDVAYVRFASVYREFCDLDTFMAELRNLKKKQKKDSASTGES